VYREAAVKYNWRILESLDQQDKLGVQKNSHARQLPAYTLDEFVRRLLRWIVADDQVSVVLSHFVCSLSLNRSHFA
jgi:hypothetical protein